MCIRGEVSEAALIALSNSEALLKEDTINQVQDKGLVQQRSVFYLESTREDSNALSEEKKPKPV